MTPRHTLFALSLVVASATPCRLPGQINGIPGPTSAPQNASAGTQQPAVSSDIQKASSLIAPAVDHLSQVVSQVQLEKWKSASRDETDANLSSIERNLKTTLPDLVVAADAQPNSVAASLPVLRNLDALCAVMIRVSVTARSNAPASQADSLAGALTTLQNARNNLSGQVQTLATAQEKQIATLQSTVTALNAKASAVPPPPPPAPAAKTPARKKKRSVVPQTRPKSASPAAQAPKSPQQ